ncbi:hypothetical protein Pcinc_008009, partial [Petrolisthes cinctipes]
SDPKESLTDRSGPEELNNGISSTPSPSTHTSASTPREDGTEESCGGKVHEDGGDIVETKKPTPMAFTIDLDGSSGASGDIPLSKKLDITASISKWAPKHRRNLSLTKVDEHKKVEERVGKPPVGRPRSGTIGATGLPQGVRRAGGYHSEGYFSSDQDDEAPRRTDLKSPRSPRTPELRSPQTPQRLVRSSSQDSAKGNSLRMRTPSPDNVSRTSSHPMTLNESASFLIEKIMSGTPETQRKQAGKSEGRSCCKGEKKPTLAEATGRAKSDKGSVKNGCKMTVEGGNKSSSGTSLNSGHTFNHKQEANSDHAKEEKDDASEAGTYTIEKDSSSPEVEEARNDIDRVFGVCAVENGGEVGTVVTPRGKASPRTSPDDLKFKSPGSLSRNSPNWIQQWAAQVAEHTKPAADPLRSPRVPSKLPPQPTQDPSVDSRPRRKLPTPPTAPHHHSSSSPFTPVSPKQSDLSDHESPTKNKAFDTHDTDALLRHTEQLVTSLQARVNKGAANHHHHHQGIRGSSFESHDSGGDSDLDTSTSYPIHDEDDRLMKIGSKLKAKLKLVGIDGDSDLETSTSYPTQDEDDRRAKIGPHLKAKLKLAGIDGTCNSPPLTKSPRKPPDVPGLESRIKLGHLKRERSIMSDGGYDVYSTGREEASMQSDSSSDASEPAKDSRKLPDNNPPLKFNRAFSLRRARLGCDDSSSSTTATHAKPPSPIDKKKVVRPSSAGNVSGTRKLPLSHSRSQSSVPRPTPPATKPATTSGTDFSRGDGGRFSLRIPRSGSGNVNQQTTNKSPSRTTTKKDAPPRRAHAPRSNSTLSSKEVDFQNWKRRKNYDPMKAAAEGRKKVNDKKSDKTNTSGAHSTSERSPSPPASLLRSASFHGTEGMGTAGRWPRRPTHLYPGEEDGPYSLEEEQSHPVPHCSPLRRSPTSPNQLASPHTTSPARQSLLSSARARRSSYALSDEGEAMLGSPTRKTSLDESGSEGKRSPSGGSTRGSGAITSTRSRAKMEALDNLVISTIHSLSVKVRTTSETLLQKLKSQYDEEGDRAALLEEVLAHLSESSDQSLTPGHTRSTSRELAGILRNLKKIEHALEVIDRVIVCEEEEEDDLDDDLEGGGGQEWGESDY